MYYFKGLTYHTAGLRHLGLSCSEVTYLLPHLQETKTTYPNLKSLDLICTSETIHAEGGGVPLRELDVFNGSPLETVVIRSKLVIRPGFDTILPWVRFTHISVTAWIWASTLVEILQICPNLKSGDFSILTSGMLFVQGPLNLAVVHKNIEELRLGFCLRSLCPLQFLTVLHFPSLKTLKISRDIDGNDDDPLEIRHAQDFQDFKTLRSLSFDCIFINPENLADGDALNNPADANALIDILHQTAVLEELILTRANIIYLAPVLAAMTFTGSNKLLPLLTTLRVGLRTPFGTPQFTDQDANPLVHMVESRSLPGLPGGCKSLERIRLSASDCVRSRDSPRIKVLEEFLHPCVAAGLLLEVGRLHSDSCPRVQPFNGWRPSTIWRYQT